MSRYRKVVVKIGSTLLTAGGTGLDRTMIAAWAEQMAKLREQGVDVVRSEEHTSELQSR